VATPVAAEDVGEWLNLTIDLFTLDSSSHNLMGRPRARDVSEDKRVISMPIVIE
jgi:hypothetical protein